MSPNAMNLAQLDLNLLVALDALLREQHVTRAGQSVGLSQPAMSAALSRLRILFEDELLLRIGSKYYRTPLAEELVQPLQQILHLVNETFERRPSFDPSADERHFVIAVSDYVAMVMFDRLLPEVAKEAPRVTFELIPTGETTRAQLDNAAIDLAFLPGTAAQQFPHTILFLDRWVCGVSEDHPEVGDTISKEQFLRLPHLVFRNTWAPSQGDQALQAIGVTRTIQVALSNFLLLPLLVQHTPYVILIYERLAQRLAPLTNIRLLKPPFELRPVPWGMYWPLQRSADPAHRWLRNKVVDLGGEME